MKVERMRCFRMIVRLFLLFKPFCARLSLFDNPYLLMFPEVNWLNIFKMTVVLLFLKK